MEEIALHVLDIVENSIRAHASVIAVQVDCDEERDLLILEIVDNGRGMDERTAKKALDPFYTEKPQKRIGLGLPLLAQAAREGGGEMEVESKPEVGTSIRATFSLSHPDRKPLGNLEETMNLLKASHPEIKFLFENMCAKTSYTEGL